MNKKTEDQLVRLAFGDLSPEEASRLQKETAGKPEAAQALDTYRRMKDELRSLADVPADQLSKERLREAILARGLKERPVRRQVSWLWMPTAAAVLAFGVVFARGHLGRSSGAPVAMLGGPTATTVASNPDFKPRMASSTKANTPVLTDEDILGFDDIESPRAETRRPRHKERDISDLMAMSYNPGAQVGDVMRASSENEHPAGPTPGGANKMTSEPVPATVASTEPPKSTTDSPIILIQPETDSNTGARKATEVESASNVLVGG